MVGGLEGIRQVQIMRPGLRPVLPRMTARVHGNEAFLPVRRWAVAIVIGEGGLVEVARGRRQPIARSLFCMVVALTVSTAVRHGLWGRLGRRFELAQ